MKLVADRALRAGAGGRAGAGLRRLGADVPWDDRRDVAWEDAVSDDPDPFDSRSLDAVAPARADVHERDARDVRRAPCTPTAGCSRWSPGMPPTASIFGASDILTWLTDLGWIMGAVDDPRRRGARSTALPDRGQPDGAADAPVRVGAAKPDHRARHQSEPGSRPDVGRRARPAIPLRPQLAAGARHRRRARCRRMPTSGC